MTDGIGFRPRLRTPSSNRATHIENITRSVAEPNKLWLNRFIMYVNRSTFTDTPSQPGDLTVFDAGGFPFQGTFTESRIGTEF